MKFIFTPKLNKVALCLLAALTVLQADAAKPNKEEPSNVSAVITDVEPNLETKTILITGNQFADDQEFIGSVELYLAETGVTELVVDSYTKEQTAAGESFEQLLVSGLPTNIAEFTGTHLLVVRKGEPVTNVVTFAVTIGGGGGGEAGPKGDPGEAGPAGPKGDPGEAGPAGQDGQAGAEGPAGADGAQGPAGNDGAQGPAGNSALSGAGVPNDSNGNDGDTYLDQTTGDIYQKIASFWILTGGNLKGPAGADGAQGEAGPQGNPGVAGPAGPQGLPGAQGPQGEQGPEGPQGPAGTNGTDGTNGIDGTNGEAGPAGADGTSVVLLGSVADFASLPEGATQGDLWVTLDTGDGWVSDGAENWTNVGQIQGPEGQQGEKGDPGDTGPKGDQGVAGPQGPAGPQGAQGDQGLTGQDGQDGVEGQAGPKGDPGEAGPQGIQGPAGNSILSGTGVPNDADGSDGDTYLDQTTGDLYLKIAGSWNPTGDNLTGPEGQQGDKGDAGQDGQAGPQGDPGPAGAKGDQGVAGPQGPAGTNGTDGINGTDGAQGPEGPQGPAGTNGTNGTDGAQGPEGPQGPAGTDGLDGAGLVGATINANGNLILTLADGSQFDAGQVGDPNTTLSISKTTVLFGPAGGPTSVDVQSNTDWNWVSSDSSWLSSTQNSPQSGNQTFSFEAAPNVNPGSRSGTITFSSGPVSRSLVVIQEGTDSVFSIDETLVEPGRAARVYNVEVRSSTDWVWESSQPWLTATTENLPQSGDATFTFEVSENTTGVTREATLVFTTVDGSYELILTVRQGPDPKPFWAQLGADIDGEAASERSGYSVSVSADGNTVAVGAISDRVRVYRYDGSNWLQLGGDIIGNNIVSLSADGNTLALGTSSNRNRTRIYQYDGSSWQQLGLDIDGETVGDESGWSVSLSADGNTVAIGAYGNDGNGESSGHTRIYRWNGSSWVQVGADIDGEDLFDSSGWSVSLSANGSTVAIGALNNDDNGSNSGHVRVYTWNGSSWNQLGADIDGEAASDGSGGSVSLSADGNTLAIGARANDGNGTNSGHVRVYTWNGSSWDQLGADINGEARLDYYGGSVSISADGNTVAIGAASNDGNGDLSGHVRVYRWSGSSWEQLDVDIDGETEGDQSGYSVSISADGSTVAIGAPFNDNSNGINSGHVRVYQLTP